MLEQVLARAEADANVAGVVLTGSHARGLATERSDYDVLIVVREQDRPWHHATRAARLDEVVCTVQALADAVPAWQRYAYRGARVLLDRLDGRIAELVERQATLDGDESRRVGRAALDAYLNQVYRAAKSRRDGDLHAARLDENESVPWLLETVFALHGRVRPYNKYLRWELATYPLPPPWNDLLAPERLPGTPFAAVEDLAVRHGLADVLQGWGADLELIRAHPVGRRPAGQSCSSDRSRPFASS